MFLCRYYTNYKEQKVVIKWGRVNVTYRWILLSPFEVRYDLCLHNFFKTLISLRQMLYIYLYALLTFLEVKYNLWREK